MAKKKLQAFIPEQKPEGDSLARHAIRIRYRGNVAKLVGNPQRGSLVRMRVFDENQKVRESAYRVVVYDLYMKSDHIRMDYDTLLELGINKKAAYKNSTKFHEGTPVEIELKACKGLYHNACYLWDHPDANMRIAIQVFVWGLLAAIPIEIGANFLSNYLTTLF